MELRKIIYLILALLMAIILVQNTQVVTFQLLFWTVALSHVFLIILLLGVGCAMGYSIRERQLARSRKKDF